MSGSIDSLLMSSTIKADIARLARHLMRASVLCCAFSALYQPVAAAVSSVGGMPGVQLRAPAGTAAFSMGGASTATPVCLTSWWNPGLLPMIKSPRLSLGMGLRSLGRTEGYASFDFRVPPRLGAGLSFIYRGDPFITGLHDENENPLDRGAYTSLTLKIGLGYLLTKKFSAGAAIGIYFQRLPTGAMENSAKLDYSSATGIGGFDFSGRYEIFNDWAVALAIRNIAASTDWQISGMTSLDVTINEKTVPEFVLSSRLDKTLAGKPFIWTSDAVLYPVDGSWKQLPHTDALLNNGFEWQRWNTFALRAGIGDLAINSLLARNSSEYFETFSFRISAGFSWDLTAVRPGLKVSYGLSTDKIWAGVDQMLDVIYSF